MEIDGLCCTVSYCTNSRRERKREQSTSQQVLHLHFPQLKMHTPSAYQFQHASQHSLLPTSHTPLPSVNGQMSLDTLRTTSLKLRMSVDDNGRRTVSRMDMTTPHLLLFHRPSVQESLDNCLHCCGLGHCPVRNTDCVSVDRQWPSPCCTRVPSQPQSRHEMRRKALSLVRLGMEKVRNGSR